MAWGIDRKRIYASEIDRHTIAEIRSKMPKSIDGVPVTPLLETEKRRGFFRMNGKPTAGNGLRRNETSTEHSDTIVALMRNLPDAKDRVTFLTLGPNKEPAFWRDSVTVESLNDCSDYDWVKEPETRIWVSHDTYLAPDIGARDRNRFSAWPAYPSIIVEVVHEHWPDEATWGHLVALSNANHLVIFYCISKEHSPSWVMSGFWKIEERIFIRSQLYLKKGILFDGLKEVEIHGSTPKERYTSANGYLIGAKQGYLEEEPKRRKAADERKKKKQMEKLQSELPRTDSTST